MNEIPSANELAEKMAKAKSDKAAAAVKAHAVEEDKKKALIEKLSQPNGISEDTILAKAVILINRAVESGQTSVEVFRFPHALCTDNGRALSQLEAGWEKTLVGVPKEIYEFWARHLKSKGYHISFVIVDYPGGMPGDVGITLSWPTEYGDHN